MCFIYLKLYQIPRIPSTISVTLGIILTIAGYIWEFLAISLRRNYVSSLWSYKRQLLLLPTVLNQWSINMLHIGAALQICLWSQLFSTLGFCDLWWYCSTNSSKNGLTQSDRSGHHSGDLDQLGHRGIYNCKIFFSGESRRGIPFLFAPLGIWDLSLIASHTVESVY